VPNQKFLDIVWFTKQFGGDAVTHKLLSRWLAAHYFFNLFVDQASFSSSVR
jgi:hypothetical protein